MVDLDPRYLQAFFEVARARSFSRAATALHKTQPAVSYQIRQLEQQLQASLFDRTTRRLTVTGAGALLLTLCERFFGEFEQLATMLRDPTAIAPPLLRIASVSGFGRYVLFPILARMPALQRYSLRYPTADQVFQSLHEGSCDLGFVYLPIVSSRLLTTAVWREELVLLAPARSRFPASIAAFTELPFVTYDESEYASSASGSRRSTAARRARCTAPTTSRSSRKSPAPSPPAAAGRSSPPTAPRTSAAR